MATTALDEEKKRKAIGYAFPQNVPEGGSIYRKRPLASDAAPQGMAIVNPDATKPLDAQAASDRQAFSDAWGAVKDVNQKLGAAIADVGTMPIRAAAGAYDTAVIRPMRAAGLNAAFMSPMVNPGSNADGSSMTPFMDQIRAKEGQPSAAAPVQPSTSAQSDTPYRNESLTATSARNIPAPVATAPTAPAAPTATNQGMGILRVDAPGASPLFTNMPTGDQSNVNMMARGTPSAQNVGAMDALAARYAGGVPAAVQPQQPAYGGMASMGAGTNTGGFGILDANYQRERALRMDASDSRNPGESKKAYESRIAGASSALNTFRGEQTAAPRLAAAQRSADAKTQADMALASRKMAFDEAQGGARMGLDAFRMQDEASTNDLRRKAAQADLDTKAQLDAARQEYLAAGDDPDKQKLAARKLAVLNGKSKDDEWGVQVTPATKNLDGTTTPGSVYKYNKATGEVVPVQGMEAGGQAKTATTGQKYTVGQTVVKPDGSRGRVVAIDANGMATEIQPI